jgi:DegV family protein with EDD domain
VCRTLRFSSDIGEGWGKAKDACEDRYGMQNVRVMTDTLAGVPLEVADQYDIKVIPAGNITYDGRSYLDGVSITPGEAYDLLQKNPGKFQTSAVAPGYLLDVYRDLETASRDILFITISSALSAFHDSASLAAELYQRESSRVLICTVDSKTVASGQGLVVLAAARAASQGMSIQEVADVASQVRRMTGCFNLLDTIRYVYRTGRMPKIACKIGAMLGVKPIAHVQDNGKLHSIGLCRTREAGIKKIVKEIRREAQGEPLHFMVLHADVPEAAEELSNRLQREFNCLGMVMGEFSPVMGYATGPGTLSVGFHPELAAGDGPLRQLSS